MVSSCATVAWTLSPARIWWMLAICGPGLKVAVAPSEKLRTMTRRSASIDCTVTRCWTDSTGIALWIRRASPLGCTLAVGAVQHPAKASEMTRSRGVTIARLSVLVLIVGIRLLLSPSSIHRTFAAYAHLVSRTTPRRVRPRAAPKRSVGGCGSGSCLCAAEPFIETDAAEARFAQRHERALLDPAAPVSGLRVAYDLTRIADRLQIAGDDFVERRSFRPGDVDDAASRRRERHIGNDGSNVVRRDGLEQAGREPDQVSIRTCSGDGTEEFQKLGRADDGVGDAGSLDQFLLGDLGAEVAIVGRPVGSDDGERDMVPDARCGLRREKVAAGGLEELQHRLVFK